MKAANICRIAMTIVTVTSLASGALATDLGSTNYKIVGATTSTGGGLLDSVSEITVMNSLVIFLQILENTQLTTNSNKIHHQTS
jgi:hypothetical protein